MHVTLRLFYLPPPPPPGIPGTNGDPLPCMPRWSGHFIPPGCYACARRAHFGQMAKWTVWTEKSPLGLPG